MACVARLASGADGELLRDLDHLFAAGTLAGLSDGELLQRFLRRRDEAAFAALLTRHGPMVRAVCRRWLGSDAASVDDAFQATFLVLVRKGASLRDGDRVGPWLYGVALRVARRARRDGGRDRGKGRIEELAEVTTMPAPDALCSAEDARALDEELERLPERLRAPLVLCYLEGLTHEQAAGQLRWPVGTVRSRMAAGRERLRGRLQRRGLGGATGLLAASAPESLAGAAVPATLAASTLKLAMSVAGGGVSAGVVPAGVAALSNGVIGAMTTKTLMYGLAAVVAAAITAGGGIAAVQGFGAAGGSVAHATGTEGPQGEAGPQGLQGEQGPQGPQRGRGRASDSVRALEQQVEELREREAALQARIEHLRRELLDVRAQEAGLDAKTKAKTKAEQPRAKGSRGSGAGGIAGGAAVGLGGAAGGPGDADAGMMSMMGGGGRGMGGMGSGMMGGYGGMAGMMRGMGMGGMMGAADPSAPVMGPGVIAMQPKGSGRVVAHSSETGGWRAYPVPEGITASPIIAGSGLALHLEGERIPEVAAYSVDKGEWNVKELVEPAEGQASPIVMQQVVMYPIGRRLYAFSILTGTWDTLELDEAVQPIVENYRAWVQDKDRLWVFTAKTGKWSTFDPGTWTELKLEGSGGGVRP